MNITQIIFPSIPKPKIVPPINNYDFDFWIVGFGECKQLMVKCPICCFTYPFQNVYDEALTKKNLREYEPHYYNTVVRNCPQKANHVL